MSMGVSYLTVSKLELLIFYKSVLLTVLCISVNSHSVHILPKSRSLKSSLTPSFIWHQQILLILCSEHIQRLTIFLDLRCYPGPGCYHSSAGLLPLPPNWSLYFIPCLFSVCIPYNRWCKPVKNVSRIMSLMGKCSSSFWSHSRVNAGLTLPLAHPASATVASLLFTPGTLLYLRVLFAVHSA